MIRHAGLIALRSGGAWRGVLLSGPSGAGKSDLALRAMADGFRLVADDRVRLFVSAGVLFGRPPTVLRDLIEVRGLGVLRHASLALAPVTLAVRCKTNLAEVERLPDVCIERILGVDTRVIDLWPFENSAIAKIRQAIETLGAGA